MARGLAGQPALRTNDGSPHGRRDVWQLAPSQGAHPVAWLSVPAGARRDTRGAPPQRAPVKVAGLPLPAHANPPAVGDLHGRDLAVPRLGSARSGHRRRPSRHCHRVPHGG
jgi:hypothetical protein